MKINCRFLKNGRIKNICKSDFPVFNFHLEKVGLNVYNALLRDRFHFLEWIFMIKYKYTYLLLIFFLAFSINALNFNINKYFNGKTNIDTLRKELAGISYDDFIIYINKNKSIKKANHIEPEYILKQKHYIKVIRFDIEKCFDKENLEFSQNLNCDIFNSINYYLTIYAHQDFLTNYFRGGGYIEDILYFCFDMNDSLIYIDSWEYP
jgi:hypothetical protein